MEHYTQSLVQKLFWREMNLQLCGGIQAAVRCQAFENGLMGTDRDVLVSGADIFHRDILLALTSVQ